MSAAAVVAKCEAYSLYRVTQDNKQHTVPAVLALIKALAVYEKEPDA